MVGPPGESSTPPAHRRFTEQHAQLLSRLGSDAGATWSTKALWACLEQLRTSNVTEAGQVAVLDAWVDGADAFCVVYEAPHVVGRVGLRRTVEDADGADDQAYRAGGMTDVYDMGAPEHPEPVAFGRNVADFDVGEPGTPGPCRLDEQARITWWGSLGKALPRGRSVF